jgi:hypothetical protein
MPSGPARGADGPNHGNLIKPGCLTDSRSEPKKLIVAGRLGSSAVHKRANNAPLTPIHCARLRYSPIKIPTVQC